MAIDLSNGYAELRSHVGHETEVVIYAGGANVALECLDCATVLLDFDEPASTDQG